MAEIKSKHWTKDEMGEAVQYWLWVYVELLTWELSQSWIQIQIKQTL